MTLKEHLTRLQQEQKNDVTLSVADAQARERAIQEAAKAEYSALLAVFAIFLPAINKIKDTMERTRTAYAQCNEALAAIHQKDVTGE